MNIKADFVKRKMLEKEITQKELGELLGNNTSGQQVVNAMLRRGSCSEQVAFKLCEILKCTIDELKAPPDIESKFIKASGQLESR